MPCTIEYIGREAIWYCCNCGDGPISWTLCPSCVDCNEERCKSCLNLTKAHASISWTDDKPEILFQPTPPESPHPPATVHSLVSRVGTMLPDSLKPTSPDSAWSTANDHFEYCSHPTEQANHNRSGGIWGTLTTEDWQCIDAAIYRHTNALVARHLSLAPFKSASSGETSSHGRKNGSSRPTVRTPRRQDRANKETNPPIRQSEKTPDNEASAKSQTLSAQKDAQAVQGYACQFFKNNAHKWRHEKTCNRSYATISDLRGHLVRVQRSPHELHECDRCLQVFADKQSLAHHRQRGQQCGWKDFDYPVEGVGTRMRDGDMIPQSKGGPKPDTFQEDDKAWWDQVYRTLFGEDVDVPSCFYDGPGDILRSNAPEREDYYDRRLVKTFKRDLPPAHLSKTLRYHLLSCLEVKVHRLTDMLRGELGEASPSQEASEIMSAPMKLQKSRRVSSEWGQNLGKPCQPGEPTTFPESRQKQPSEEKEIALTNLLDAQIPSTDRQLQHEGTFATRTDRIEDTSVAPSTPLHSEGMSLDNGFRLDFYDPPPLESPSLPFSNSQQNFSLGENMYNSGASVCMPSMKLDGFDAFAFTSPSSPTGKVEAKRALQDETHEAESANMPPPKRLFLSLDTGALIKPRNASDALPDPKSIEDPPLDYTTAGMPAFAGSATDLSEFDLDQELEGWGPDGESSDT